MDFGITDLGLNPSSVFLLIAGQWASPNFSLLYSYLYNSDHNIMLRYLTDVGNSERSNVKTLDKLFSVAQILFVLLLSQCICWDSWLPATETYSVLSRNN